MVNGTKLQLIRDGGTILLLAVIVVTVLRGDWLPRVVVDRLAEGNAEQLAGCERSRDALEATLRSYSTREQNR